MSAVKWYAAIPHTMTHPVLDHFTDSASHAGKHPLEPANLEKHVAKANPKAAPQQQQAAPAPAPSKKPTASANAIEFSQIPARYKRPLLSEAEMEVIQVSKPYHKKHGLKTMQILIDVPISVVRGSILIISLVQILHCHHSSQPAL